MKINFFENNLKIYLYNFNILYGKKAKCKIKKLLHTISKIQNKK